ncbi:MAG: hypothetical protein HYV01_00495 [Deltaproteobacteria bacterium]|jgi:hypothetical protein|nr:hypothetical protein [Deltaproteobacteria bacterium]
MLAQRIVSVVFGVLLIGTFAACEKKQSEGPAERAGKEVDKAMEQVGQKVEEVGKKMQGAGESAKEAPKK